MKRRCPFHKSALNAVTVAAQAVAANGYLNFARETIYSGCAIEYTPGSNTITIENAGLYAISFDADVLPAAAAPITIQLTNNGVAVDGAEATFTGVADTTNSVSFQTLLQVLPGCCAVNNAQSLQVLVTAAATVTNANISVVKLA